MEIRNVNIYIALPKSIEEVYPSEGILEDVQVRTVGGRLQLYIYRQSLKPSEGYRVLFRFPKVIEAEVEPTATSKFGKIYTLIAFLSTILVAFTGDWRKPLSLGESQSFTLL